MEDLVVRPVTSSTLVAEPESSPLPAWLLAAKVSRSREHGIFKWRWIDCDGRFLREFISPMAFDTII